jgi:hypothetical protein
MTESLKISGNRDRGQEIRDKTCRETFMEETLGRKGSQLIRRNGKKIPPGK